MIRIRLAHDTDQQAWNAYVSAKNVDHHAWNFQWSRIFQHVFGHRALYWLAEREDAGRTTVCGIAPAFLVKSVLFGKALISVPYLNGGGILADNDEALLALKAEAAHFGTAHGVRYIELRQRTACPALHEAPERTHKVAMRLALQKDPEQLFQSFPAKLRSQVRRPAKAGVSAEVLPPTPSSLAKFYTVFAENMRDLGTPVYPRELFVQTAAEFAAESRIVLAYLNNEPIAAGFLLGHGRSMEIPWASSLKRFNNLSANMLMYWEALKAACLLGYEWFDFGRSSLDSGTHRFKAQWGAQPQALHWYYPDSASVPDVNPHSPKFAAFVRCWQFLPLGLSKVLGPWLTKSLP